MIYYLYINDVSNIRMKKSKNLNSTQSTFSYIGEHTVSIWTFDTAVTTNGPISVEIKDKTELITDLKEITNGISK